ncbi:sensor histidine kinase [Pleionea mediterranea]|uniref:histidine kinase n=1 Tax=Pleionea mediterranea TaxID=523701 RepID=A0A316FPX5_9GAMM|nr:ATP-binding protein [Pleionea mediterranea]PWK50734.1 signal transduction histidine kinase [Pleionea mediterranea]
MESNTVPIKKNRSSLPFLNSDKLMRNFIVFSKASFRTQLLSFFSFSVLLLAITTSLITSWNTSELTRESSIERGKQLAENFAEQSVLSLLTRSEENALSAVDIVTNFKDVIAATILTLDGEQLIHRGSSQFDEYNHPLENSKESILFSETSDRWIFSAPVYYQVEDEFDALGEVTEKPAKEYLGQVFIELNKAEMISVQRSIFTNNIAIALALSAILSLLMYWGVGQLTRPLTELSESMRSVKDGEQYQKSPIKGAKEFRQMATVYNQMMVILEKQRKEIESHRDVLEAEVEIRTKDLVVARDSALTASRHKSEFLANISHELRTPLQAIIGYTDLIKEELELDGFDQLTSDANRILISAQGLLTLINGLLDLAKVEAGKMELHRTPTDISSLLDEACETLKPLIEKNNNHLDVIKKNLERHVLLDRQKVLQILYNLLGNACKFTKDGKIKVSAKLTETNIQFSVSDTGVGIEKNKLNSIFEPFSQVDAGESRKHQGTGLGLAISKKFCDLMNGSIKVESQPGKGSLFTVTITLNE